MKDLNEMNYCEVQNVIDWVYAVMSKYGKDVVALDGEERQVYDICYYVAELLTTYHQHGCPFDEECAEKYMWHYVNDDDRGEYCELPLDTEVVVDFGFDDYWIGTLTFKDGEYFWNCERFEEDFHSVKRWKYIN